MSLAVSDWLLDICPGAYTEPVDVLEWNKEVDASLKRLKGWNSGFGTVVGLGTEGVEAVGAFGKVVTGIQERSADFVRKFTILHFLHQCLTYLPYPAHAATDGVLASTFAATSHPDLTAHAPHTHAHLAAFPHYAPQHAIQQIKATKRSYRGV